MGALDILDLLHKNVGRMEHYLYPHKELNIQFLLGSQKQDPIHLMVDKIFVLYLIYSNYERILSWNRSLRFALAVCTLKDKFKNEI